MSSVRFLVLVISLVLPASVLAQGRIDFETCVWSNAARAALESPAAR